MLTRLCHADHPAAVWAGAVEPWLRAHGVNWRERRALLVPNSAWAAALKSQAMGAGLTALGIAWFTPGSWRSHALRAKPGPPLRLALREDLHFLLEVAAARLPDNLLARAFRADPAPLQELLDALDGAGWDHTVLPDAAARELAALAADLRARAGWTTTAAADRLLRAAVGAGELPSLGERLLAVGFGPGDWSLRPLLETAALAYREAEFAFDALEPEAPATAAWLGTWEETGLLAESLEPPPALAAPWRDFQSAFAAGDLRPSTHAAAAHPKLWLAEDLQAEADLVMAQALAFLGEAGGTVAPRVGIVVGPVNSPLAREVAARLAALELPFHDAPGHAPGRGPAQTAFEAWLDWQEDGRLGGWLAWARCAHRLGRLGAREFFLLERDWRHAAAATLSDDPAVVAAWLRTDSKTAPETLAFLGAWPRVPDNVSWDAIMSDILPVAERLGWPDPPEALAARAAAVPAAPLGPLPRAAALRWLRAVTRVPGRTRDARAREPFAPLQIAEAAGAAAQPWTHLVLAGLQHGEWPADDEDSPLLDEAHLAALNRRVLRRGSHGEGHTAVTPGHGWLLTAVERRRQARAAFARLLGLPSAGLALATRHHDPGDGRPARLSEFFWTAATQALGRLPEEKDLEQLRRATRAACAAAAAWLGPPALPAPERAAAPSPAAAARAHAARRKDNTPFDEFSFCLAAAPPAPLRLSCKQWDDALARPGASWFRHLLGVTPQWNPATEDDARLSLGSWAHAWIKPGPAGATDWSAPPPLPGEILWQQLASDRADSVRAQVAAAFAVAGRPLPEAWLELWTQTARLVRDWIAALQAVRETWPRALAEARLPPELAVELPAAAARIPLTGQLDLVLCAAGGLAGGRAWLLDFKTGGDLPLSIKRLAKGGGLQLALYALSLGALGAAEVELSVLSREGVPALQLTLVDFDDPGLAGLWLTLAEFAAGRWGEVHDLTDSHARPGDYPSATLPVPAELLREKWRRTHPAFQVSKSDNS